METQPVGKKVVLLPIRVPKGDYCWSNKHGMICENFTNESGEPRCLLMFTGLVDFTAGEVKKPYACAELKELI